MTCLLRSLKHEQEGGDPPEPCERCRCKPASSISVLLADDSAPNRKMARAFLEQKGCRVVAVADGRAAVEAARTEAFNLVFLDLDMPELDGREAARLIRSEARARDRVPRLVALSGSVSKSTLDDLRIEDFDAALPKPLRVDELFATVDRLLSGRSAEPREEAPPETAEPPLFDRQRLLAEFGGDAPLMAECLEEFAVSLPELLAGVADGLERNDGRAAAGPAHALKGAICQVSLGRPYALVVQLESAAARGRRESAVSTFRQLKTVLDELLGQLRAFVDEQPASSLVSRAEPNTSFSQ